MKITETVVRSDGASDTVDVTTIVSQGQLPPSRGPARATPEADTASRIKLRDKDAEVRQLVELMTPYARINGKRVYLYIPREGQPALMYRLSTTKKDGEQARLWVMNKYKEACGCIPLVQTFNEACIQLQASLHSQNVDTATDNEDEAVDEYRRDKAILRASDWNETGIELQAKFARVTIASGPALSGLYRLTGKRTLRLTDAYVQVIRIVRPSGSSKNARTSSIVLKFTNRDGLTKQIEITDEQFLNNELANKLSVFATYPEDERSRRYFLEAVKALARYEGVAVQEQTESLGWQKSDEGALLWATASGVETLKGFIPSDEAPCVAPSITSTGNGYSGMSISPELNSPDADYWLMLINDFAPHKDVQAIILALLGLSALVMLPEGVAPSGIGIENGTLRISPDIIGPSRHGKSRIINAVLSIFGTGFVWNKNPLTTYTGGIGGDTGLGRNGLMSMMKHHLWADFDHKDKPGLKDFERQHKIRSATIENYVDGASGGTKSSRTGDMRGRGVPAGCSVRTCNYDHATTSIDEDMDMIEARACTFEWPKGVKGNWEVSVKLDTLKNEQAYGLGQDYRRWLMERMASDPEELKALVSDAYYTARALVDERNHEWAYDYHRNHTDLLIMGCWLWMTFLLEVHPEHSLLTLIDSHVPDLITNRIERSEHVRGLVMNKSEAAGLDAFVVEALHDRLSGHVVYIRSQKDELLTKEDIEGLPFSLKDIGYRSDLRDGVEVFYPGSKCIGYLANKKQSIALDTTLLLKMLQAEAGQKIIIEKKAVLLALAEKGLLLPELDKSSGKITRYEQKVRIAGKSGPRYAVIPVSALFVAEALTYDEDEDDTEAPRPPEGPCIHCASVLKLPKVIDDTLIWICAKCKTECVQQPSREQVSVPDDRSQGVSKEHANPFYDGALPEDEDEMYSL